MPSAAVTPDSTESIDSRTFQTLHMQLERMRAMHYKYSDLFYKLITLGVVTLLVLTIASLTDSLRAAALLIPFFTIYVGVQSAYFLAYVVFARVYATGIEKRINEMLRADVLIGHRIEAAYLFPLAGPQFAGVAPRFGQTFIGFITIHFWILGAAAIGLAAYRAWQLSPELETVFPPAAYYLPALAVWSAFHLLYLVWYFGTRRYELAIMNVVTEAYRTNYERS